MAVDMRRALTFGTFAEDYALWRPELPANAVDWLIPNNAKRVADVGAGTGKLTGLLLDRGLTVDAVEPDERMLQVLARLHPAAVPQLGSAEALPLPESSVDAVLVAEAWHWFARDAAVQEVRRVLRPDGWLGLAWNVHTPVQDWEFELGIDPDRKSLEKQAAKEIDRLWSFPPEETETATFQWVWEVTPRQWRSFLATNSGVAAMPETERDQRLSECEAIVERVCQDTGRPTAPLQHKTSCLRWKPTARLR